MTSAAPVPPLPVTSDDHALARDLATQAGELLVGLRTQLLATLEPKAAGKAADAAAQDLLAQALAEHRPGDAILSEEAVDDHARLNAERVWIVDPLDGTREFSEDGRTDWAVHVALWSPTGAAGAVALPDQGLTLTTLEPPARAARTATDPIRVVHSRTRPPALLAPLGEAVPLVLQPHGSAGAKAAEVILGRADAYLHDGGLNQWDAAAPVVVALAAGLHASHLDGSPIVFNGADVVTGDVLICRPELAEVLLTALVPLLP